MCAWSRQLSIRCSIMCNLPIYIYRRNASNLLRTFYLLVYGKISGSMSLTFKRARSTPYECNPNIILCKYSHGAIYSFFCASSKAPFLEGMLKKGIL